MIEKGYTINYIKVISNEEKKDGRKSYYFCECHCGNKKWVLKSTLESKRIRDCGCGTYMIERHLGEKYGLLTIENCFRKRINGKINIIAKCKCDCGNYRNIPVSNLKSNKRVSCGCIQKFDFERDYKGKKYNDIEILNIVDIKKKRVLCRCHCGNIFECKLSDITAKKNPIISCAKCYSNKKNKNKKIIKKLKQNYNRLYNIYLKMIDRCYNINSKDYKWYGDRQIKVCEEWKNSYKAFEKWALENGYQDNLTIDRINTNCNYEPSNCRWVDMITQQNNRRNNVKYNYNGVFLTLSQIARKENFNINTLRSRIKSGMSLINALTLPIKRK